MSVSKNGGKPPKMDGENNGNPIKMDDLGVPLFLETPIYIYININIIYIYICIYTPEN